MEKIFREIWTTNANKISELYSGTGALKVDFTRYGRRTIFGAIEDGRRSLLRYIYNNLHDTYNQNSIDYLLGKISWREIKDNKSIEGKSVFFTSFIVL